MNGYSSAFQHLSDELTRLTLLLHRAVLLNRALHASTLPISMAGHVVDSTEVDGLLDQEDLLAARWRVPPMDEMAAARIEKLDAQALERRQEIDAKVEATAIRLPLVRLASEFYLSGFELEVLLLAAAPELDPSYEQIYAEFHDDATRRRPSVDLALQVLSRNELQKVEARAKLSPGAPLLHYRFLTLGSDRHNGEATLLRKTLLPDESMVRFLLGQTPGVLTAGRLLPGSASETAGVSSSTRERLQQFADAVMRHDPDHFTLVLQGGRGDLQLAAAVLAANLLDRSLLYLDASTEAPSEQNLLTAIRDSALWDAILTVRMPAGEAWSSETKRQSETIVWPATLAASRRPIILLSPSGQLPAAPAADAILWTIAVDAPPFEERLALWKEAAPSIEDQDARVLADTFRFSARQVQQAQYLAYGRAALRNPSDPAVTSADLSEASRDLAAPQLNRFAIPLQPRYRWADLVLPKPRLAQLQAIANRVRARAQVLNEWKFGEKHIRGNGLTVLFTGASGTGKTMAAEVLAKELGVGLFQIDLSAVVSKYVGDTEKHLAAIFDEAEMSNALLFFDEADALFGKRTELKDAHDRYANIEVNYLLQRLERYQGLVILSTNFQKNMDDAFLRRIQETVDFPYPDEESRTRIWQGLVPHEAPKEAIDYAYLGRRFKLSGGNIRSAVLNAAYLAAADKQPISMHHLVRAVREEYLKLGRLVLKHDFEPYFLDLQQGGKEAVQ